jgi:hypothetical protein
LILSPEVAIAYSGSPLCTAAFLNSCQSSVVSCRDGPRARREISIHDIALTFYYNNLVGWSRQRLGSGVSAGVRERQGRFRHSDVSILPPSPPRELCGPPEFALRVRGALLGEPSSSILA